MEPAFMLDHMVIRLGKYLRIAGFDAQWDKQARTHELILRANAENRVFLTRNHHLPDQHPKVNRVLVLETSDPVDQLRRVTEAFQLDLNSALFTRCVRCNVALAPVPDRESVRARVHPNVMTRQQSFYRCPACDTIFWKGSHVRNTCRKLGLSAPPD